MVAIILTGKYEGLLKIITLVKLHFLPLNVRALRNISILLVLYNSFYLLFNFHDNPVRTVLLFPFYNLKS